MSNIIKNSDYMTLFVEVKEQIKIAQQKAIMSVNLQMLTLYFKIGKIVIQKQEKLGWGAKVIQKLAVDIKNELPEVKGFSARNLKLMVQFYNEYKDSEFGQQVVAQNKIAINMQPLVAQIPWTHNVLLIQRVKDRNLREWYITKILAVLKHV